MLHFDGSRLLLLFLPPIILFISDCAGSSLLCGFFPPVVVTGGFFVAVVVGLLITVASLVAEYGFYVGRVQWLQHLGSIVASPMLKSVAQ